MTPYIVYTYGLCANNLLDLLGCRWMLPVRQEKRMVVHPVRRQYRSNRHFIRRDQTTKRHTIQLTVPCLSRLHSNQKGDHSGACMRIGCIATDKLVHWDEQV